MSPSLHEIITPLVPGLSKSEVSVLTFPEGVPDGRERQYSDVYHLPSKRTIP